MKFLPALALSLYCLGAVAAVPGAACSAASGERKVAVLELYTSEGCNSCPPADNWISTLPAKGLGPDKLVALALHVDYWNYLGWKDPFSQSQFSERQRWVNRLNRAGFVYTPQLVLNGKDYRRSLGWDNFAERVRDVNRGQPGADIRLSAMPASSALEVSANARLKNGGDRRRAQLYLALYENDLANDVRAGENAGRRLQHDFVVRQWAGPFAFDASGEAKVQQHFNIAENWKRKDLVAVALVQNNSSGDMLQALALPLCRP